MSIRYYFAFVLIILFSSCEKELDIKLSESGSSLVVEGQIEQGSFPIVFLSKSIGFFDKIDFTKVQYVKDAVVRVTDLTSSQSITLKNYAFDTLVNGQNFEFSVYAPDTVDFLKILGQTDHIYKLEISYDNKLYESITKVPAMVAPDSVFTKARLIPNTTDSAYEVYFTYNDPDTNGNYFRYETKRFSNDSKYNTDWLTPQNSLFSDVFLNGNTLNLNLSLAYNDTIQFDTPEQFFPYVFMTKGDSAQIKLMAIDYSTYNFWNTVEFARGSVGNPFSSPIKVQGNISNGALGVWAGYGTSFFTCKAPQ